MPSLEGEADLSLCFRNLPFFLNLRGIVFYLSPDPLRADMKTSTTVTFLILSGFLLLFGVVPSLVSSGQYNRVLDIGDESPSWKGLPSTTGEPHSLDPLGQANAIVVVFTCNTCPYAVDVEQRLIALHKDYKEKGVAIVAINANSTPDDSMERMQEKPFEFPYLRDESQQVAKAFGAKYTPEFFVVDDQKKIVYMGSMDDSPDGKQIERQYVREALERCLSNIARDQVAEEVVFETVPIGCRIRFKRERRKKRNQ